MKIVINNPAGKSSPHNFVFDSKGAYGAQASNNLISNSAQIKLWRYNFKEKEADDNEPLYATLLVQPPTSGSEAKIETRVFLFVRKGQSVDLDTSNPTLVPGLNFPVGGITLIPKKAKIDEANQKKTDENKNKVDETPEEEPEIVIGNAAYITDAEPICGSYREATATKIITNKIPCNGCILGWDLVFAWQSPSAPKTPTRNLIYKDKHSRITEQGDFATFSDRLSNDDGVLGRRSFCKGTNAWILGWSANGTTDGFIKLGPDAKQSIAASNFRVESFLSGFMDSEAAATWSVVKTDTALLNGTKLPLIARSDTANMPGQLSQLFIAGRTFLVQQDDDERTNTVNQSDQSLQENLLSGTTIDFLGYLPTK
jgi:hypothetical protein